MELVYQLLDLVLAPHSNDGMNVDCGRTPISFTGFPLYVQLQHQKYTPTILQRLL